VRWSIIMELRHLRYFVLVAEELHFSRAAERAGIAQPPLSQQVRSLEAELGVELFHRTKRRVSLTDAGRALLPRARQLLDDASRAEAMTRAAGQGMLGEVRIGFVGSLAFGTLPGIVRELGRTVPEIQVTLREYTSAQQVEALIAERIDLALARYAINDPTIESTLLSSEPLLIASRREFSERPVTVLDIADEPLIMFPRAFGSQLHDRIMTLFMERGVTPRIEQEAVQMTTIIALVAAGIGSAIVPSSMQALQIDGVHFHRFVDAKGREPLAEIHLLHRRSDQSAVLAQVIDRITRQSLV
jgi:DNA-binding transcriptional LysR family regulator